MMHNQAMHQVGAQASCHVGYELCNQVRSQVRISIWDQVRDRVKFQVCYHVSTQMLEDFDDA